MSTIALDELKLVRNRFKRAGTHEIDQSLQHASFVARHDLGTRVAQLKDYVAHKAQPVRTGRGRAIALSALGMGVLSALVAIRVIRAR